MSVSPHPSISVPKKKYRSVKQWSGKEYRNAACIMLSVLEATLEPFPATVEQQEIFDKSLDCICALLDFNLMAQYKSHSFPANTNFDNEYHSLWDGYNSPDPKDTISYLQHYLALFHNNKSTFLKYRASKTVKRDATVYAAGSVPAIDSEDMKTMTKAEITAKNKADIALRKTLKEEYMVQHSSYNMPKVHLMKHFGEVIPHIGVLGQFSTSIVELNHQPLNRAYEASNKVDATEQTLRYAGHRDAMSVRVSNLTWLIQDTTVDEEVVKDVMLWLDIFGSRKARLAAARINRNRMKPKRVDSEEKAKKKAMREDRDAFIASLRADFGVPDKEVLDDSEDGDLTDDERDMSTRDTTPGRLLRGRMLHVSSSVGRTYGLMTVGDIERHLSIVGLVDALLDLMKKEGIYKQLSADVIRSLNASPFMSLRIRRPVFQSADELENHILRCTTGENFRNSPPRADFVMYRRNTGGDEVLLGENGVGQLLCFFRVDFPLPPSEHSLKSAGRFAAIRPLVSLPLTKSQCSRGLPRLQWSSTHDIMVIRVGSIQRSACVVPILSSLRMDIPEKPSELFLQATRFILNTKVDLETFANIY
jgi:hypothetical protein